MQMTNEKESNGLKTYISIAMFSHKFAQGWYIQKLDKNKKHISNFKT
jgi:hypothetical protein